MRWPEMGLGIFGISVQEFSHNTLRLAAIHERQNQASRRAFIIMHVLRVSLFNFLDTDATRFPMKFTNPFVGCAAIALTTIATPALAQQPGTNVPENHPPLSSKLCRRVSNKAPQPDQSTGTPLDTSINCANQDPEVMPSDTLVHCETEATSVVIDADQRVLNAVGTTNKCLEDGKWNATVCSTPEACAAICGLEGGAYETYHNVSTHGDVLSLKLSRFEGKSPRVYLLDASGTKYKQFQLLNQEFTFDVDMSLLPCGGNGALYFVKMDADGGTARFPTNTAGAKYGTGYCDAQCQKDIHFINGEANINKTYGACCSEMDIWEANRMATVYTSHACSISDQERCSTEEECGFNGWCDKSGCGYNPFRMGNPHFYGPGKEFDIDTTRPFTVVTQFVTRDNTATGELVEIRRLYKQDNRVIGNPYSTWKGLNVSNSITDATCNATKSYFGKDLYKTGDLAELGRQMIGGMTLAMSIWVDFYTNMTWLDTYENNKDPNLPGARGGPCPNPGGDPASVFAASPDATVQFINIRSGDFGTTY
ncbi:hypothetical protein PsorP6_011043 [Peronosclerospora sorghi]|uniref:Uncharacterized protein n=1 Tax=Peronosclerospora sorghi TaxID=230839 RepID=A0ACC0VVJ3_9STRA|nr:hypothetical protein PsorP6_011043 [Peronosclerospora sorghi]